MKNYETIIIRLYKIINKFIILFYNDEDKIDWEYSGGRIHLWPTVIPRSLTLLESKEIDEPSERSDYK